MSDAVIIDGKAFAADLRAEVGRKAALLKESHGLVPGLSVVLVGDDPASHVYIRNKGKATAAAGMESQEYRLPATASHAEVLETVERLNADDAVHGILVQLPLPNQVDSNAIINAIDPDKDVDGFHTVNVGRLTTGQDSLVPCTPLGCLLMLRHFVGELKGKRAMIVGRSNIVGKPMASLLLREHCTVTIGHSRTQDLPGECRRADVLIAAVGRAEMIRGRLGEARRRGHRRRHQPRAGGRENPLGGRRLLRGGGGERGLDHARARRRRAHDHRLPAQEHAQRRLPPPRDRRADVSLRPGGACRPGVE